jgi:hypothetical protein
LLGVRSAIHFGILFGDEWKDFLFFEGLWYFLWLYVGLLYNRKLAGSWHNEVHENPLENRLKIAQILRQLELLKIFCEKLGYTGTPVNSRKLSCTYWILRLSDRLFHNKEPWNILKIMTAPSNSFFRMLFILGSWPIVRLFREILKKLTIFYKLFVQS